MKTYEEMMATCRTFKERFEYLKIGGKVGEETFGSRRYINQLLYKADPDWKSIRRKIIIRDNGCNLALPDQVIRGKVKVNGEDREIKESIYVHHIEPITLQDVLERSPKVFDPNNLICTNFKTHQAIHYGSWGMISDEIIERKPNDTIPWRH